MKSFIPRIRFRFPRRSRGQSLVEFAMVAPVLILLFMGMFDFGWILHQQIQMDNATRLGARRGAVGENNATIISRMQDSCSFALPAGQITIIVRDSQGNSVGNNTDRTPDNQLYVAIDRNNVDLVTPLGNFVEGMTSIDLHSEAEFLIE